MGYGWARGEECLNPRSRGTAGRAVVFTEVAEYHVSIHVPAEQQGEHGDDDEGDEGTVSIHVPAEQQGEPKADQAVKEAVQK